MLPPRIIFAMRCELEKLATQAATPPPPQHEEMTKAKWIQAAKDIPVALLGGMAGYGLGRTSAEFLVPKVFAKASPELQGKILAGLPWAAAGTAGLGSYLLMHQQRRLRQRREQAEQAAQKEMGGTMTAEAEQPRQTPVNAPTPKMAMRRGLFA